MVFLLILGALLGAISVIFVLQNITPITVTFFMWHFDGSLSIILFLTLLSGMLITILLLVPGFIRDEFHFAALRKQNKDLEDELRAARNNIAEIALRDAPRPASVEVHEELVM